MIKNIISFMIIYSLAIFSTGCGATEYSKEEIEMSDSFALVDTYSFDNEFCAKQSIEINEGIEYVRVEIWDKNGKIEDSFLTERARDFWGICWEKDTYNLWIQSGDVGIYCMEYVDGKWKTNRNKERPDYIKSKYDN